MHPTLCYAILDHAPPARCRQAGTYKANVVRLVELPAFPRVAPADDGHVWEFVPENLADEVAELLLTRGAEVVARKHAGDTTKLGGLLKGGGEGENGGRCQLEHHVHVWPGWAL